MSGMPAATGEIERLPALIRSAMQTLDSAKSAGEILDARNLADAVYNAAKTANRLQSAMAASEKVQQASRKVMGDAISIEMRALARLACEYDDAVARGEAHAHGRPKGKGRLPTVADLGLDHARIFEARAVAAAEKAQPGVVRRAVQERLASAQTPTKEHVKRAISAVSGSKISRRHKRTSGSKRSTGVELPAADTDVEVVIDDVARVLELADRVRSRYGDGSADVRALCTAVERLVAVHVRARRHGGEFARNRMAEHAAAVPA
jgi:hypothetical protein